MSQKFLGRTQEIDKFTEVIDCLVNTEVSFQKNIKPYIFLYSGVAGIGKTDLLDKLKEVAETKLAGNLNTISLDWKRELYDVSDLQVGHDYIQPNTVLEVIYNSFEKQEKDNYFDSYLETKKSWKLAKEKINEALESELENETIQELIPLGADGIAQLIKEDKYNSGEDEFKVAQEFVESHLKGVQQEIYKDPEINFAQALGSGITKLAKEKALIIFLDNYDIVDKPECDYILRQAIRYTYGPIVWVIAGRTNLADSGWRNPQAKDALLAALHEEEQDADVIAVAIKLLENFDNAIAVQELIRFLEHQDRFVRRAAARELGKLVKYETDRKNVLDLAVEPLIQVMRNNPISNVRDTALEALISIYNAVTDLKNNSEEKIKVKRALWREKDRDYFPKFIKNQLIGERKEQISDLANTDNLLELIRNLQDSKAEVKEGSIELIAKKSALDKSLAKDAIKSLIPLLYNSREDADVRVAAITAIGEIKVYSQDVADALVDALNFDKQTDRYVREAAAEILGKFVTPDNLINKIVNALNKAVREDVISNVRNTAQSSLENILDKTGSELAKRYLQKINSEHLEPIKNNQLDKIIYIFKHSHNIDERIKATQALAQINSPKSISILKQALAEPEPDICTAAADGLGRIGNPNSLKVLIAKVKDKKKPEYYKDRIAREAVVKAIGNLNLTPKQLDEEQVVEILINIWRNDAISNVRDTVEFSMQKIYQRNQHPHVYKALKRYPDYDNNEKQAKYNDMNTVEYYNSFFKTIDLSNSY